MYFFEFISDELFREVTAAITEDEAAFLREEPPTLAPDEYGSLLAVREVTVLPDGRVEALVETIFPTKALGVQVDFSFFVEEDGRWLIDGIVAYLADQYPPELATRGSLAWSSPTPRVAEPAPPSSVIHNVWHPICKETGVDTMRRPSGVSPMPTILAVVGEHRDDPDHLLLLGEDGLHYDLRLTDGFAVATEPGEEWQIDPGAEPEVLFE